ELAGLIADGRADLRVAVPRGRDGDAGGHVQEQIAIDVLDDATAAAFDKERVNARVGRGHVALVAREHGLAARAGRGRANVRDRASIEQPHGVSSVRETSDRTHALYFNSSSECTAC